MIQFKPGTRIVFNYINHRGEISKRHCVVVWLEYLTVGNEYYPAGTWLLRCFDLDKQADRSFNLAKIDVDGLVFGQ